MDNFSLELGEQQLPPAKQSGFYAAGIRPFNPSAIPDDAFSMPQDTLMRKENNFSPKQTLPGKSKTGAML
jgi:hypothetical protein